MKICIDCKNSKTLDQFSWKIKDKNILNPRCRPCSTLYNRKYYHDVDKEKQLNRVVKNKKKYIQEFREWKKSLSCFVCDENSPECLDFHHLDPDKKEYSVSRLANSGLFRKALTEAEKCVVVCSNCHRKIHSGKIELNAGVSPVPSKY